MLQVNQNVHTSTNKGFLQESRKRRGGAKGKGPRVLSLRAPWALKRGSRGILGTLCHS